MKKFHSILQPNKEPASQYRPFQMDRSNNISSQHIPDSILNVLSLGERFALPVIPNNKTDCQNTVIDIIKNIEANTYKIPDNIIDETRSQISVALHKFLGKTLHVSYVNRFIIGKFVKCRKFLRQNDNVFVARAAHSNYGQKLLR